MAWDGARLSLVGGWPGLRPLSRIGGMLEFFVALAAAARSRLGLLLEVLRLIEDLDDPCAGCLPWAGCRDSVSLFGEFGGEWLARRRRPRKLREAPLSLALGWLCAPEANNLNRKTTPAALEALQVCRNPLQ